MNGVTQALSDLAIAVQVTTVTVLGEAVYGQEGQELQGH